MFFSFVRTMENLFNILSKKDAITLLELIQEATRCNEEKQFVKLFKSLANLFDFKSVICALAKFNSTEIEGAHKIFNITYPAEWMGVYQKKNFLAIDPIVKENFLHFKVQHWSETYKKSPPPREFRALAEDFHLREGYTFGLKNSQGGVGSLFSLAGPKVDKSHRTAVILEAVIPHFHQALIRVMGGIETKSRFSITPREKEVLNWLKEGKKTWDISIILGISERTVKYHVNRIMGKLDAVSRLHAVAIAVENGLIER